MNIVAHLFQIITLQRRPSDIGYDPSAAIIAFMAAVASGYFQIAANKTFSYQPLPFVLTQAVVQAAIFWGLLRIRGKDSRFVQTITALFGVAAILQFVGLLIMQFPALIIFGVVITAWNFYLMILILSEAIDCTIGQSILITIAYHFIMGMFLLTLFPELFEQMQSALKASNGP